MALIQHLDPKVRFAQQVDNARAYVLPFINRAIPVHQEMTLLDIGCGDGGVLLPFLEMGCKATGIELDVEKSNHARNFLAEFIQTGQVEIINLNIYEEAALQDYKEKFDIILLKDVIEHIPDQSRFIPYMKQFLKPGGVVYFGFPPWQMPHGGHQQVCRNRFLSVLPYFHLLPAVLYSRILRLGGEYESTINELLEIKTTGISIERFEKLALAGGYSIVASTHYLINPIYRFKFGWQPREQFSWLRRIPILRNFFTTCVYYLIRRN
jgi:SAM-dependent methyltransferase